MINADLRGAMRIAAWLLNYCHGAIKKSPQVPCTVCWYSFGREDVMATVFPELYETTRQRAFDAFVAGAVVGGLVMVLVFGGMLWFTRYPDFAGPFPFVVLLHWPLTAVMFFVGLAIFGVPC